MTAPHPHPLPQPFGVKWDALFLIWSGYSTAARSYVLGLDREGIHVQIGIVNIQFEQSTDKLDPTVLGRLEALSKRRANPDVYVASCVPYLDKDLYAVFRRLNPGFKYYVGYTVFEADRAPDAWVAPCNGMDEIWTPSRFSRDALVRAGVAAEKIQVVPHSIDPDLFDPAVVKPLPLEERGEFCFLSVFDWGSRKGWDILLDAYLQAFSPSDPVSLLIHTSHGSRQAVKERIRQFLAKRGRRAEDKPLLLVSDQPLAEREIPSLYRVADAFVLPSRGEGWGLPYMEAMTMGLPTIGTRWGGNLDFMNDANSFLIDCEEVPIHKEDLADGAMNRAYFEGRVWARPSVEHTARLMRAVYDDREKAKRTGAAAREFIVRHFSTREVSRQIIAHFQRIVRTPAFQSRAK